MRSELEISVGKNFSKSSHDWEFDSCSWAEDRFDIVGEYVNSLSAYSFAFEIWTTSPKYGLLFIQAFSTKMCWYWGLSGMSAIVRVVSHAEKISMSTTHGFGLEPADIGWNNTVNDVHEMPKSNTFRLFSYRRVRPHYTHYSTITFCYVCLNRLESTWSESRENDEIFHNVFVGNLHRKRCKVGRVWAEPL